MEQLGLLACDCLRSQQFFRTAGACSTINISFDGPARSGKQSLYVKRIARAKRIEPAMTRGSSTAIGHTRRSTSRRADAPLLEKATMKPTIRLWMIAGASVVVLASAADARAQDIPPPTGKKIDYSPYPAKDFPNRVYFGDTHLHTSYSTDAGMIGNTLGPEEAYRFARGEEVKSSTGLPAKLDATRTRPSIR